MFCGIALCCIYVALPCKNLISFKKLAVAEIALGPDAIDLILDMPSSSRSSKLESPRDFQRNEIPSWFESSVEDLLSAMKPTLLSIGGRSASEATGEAQLIYGSGSDMFNFKRHKLLWLSTISLETYLEMEFMKLNVLSLLTGLYIAVTTRKHAGGLMMHLPVQIIFTGQFSLTIYHHLFLLWNKIFMRMRGGMF